MLIQTFQFKRFKYFRTLSHIRNVHFIEVVQQQQKNHVRNEKYNKDS